MNRSLIWKLGFFLWMLAMLGSSLYPGEVSVSLPGYRVDLSLLTMIGVGGGGLSLLIVILKGISFLIQLPRWILCYPPIRKEKRRERCTRDLWEHTFSSYVADDLTGVKIAVERLRPLILPNMLSLYDLKLGIQYSLLHKNYLKAYRDIQTFLQVYPESPWALRYGRYVRFHVGDCLENDPILQALPKHERVRQKALEQFEKTQSFLHSFDQLFDFPDIALGAVNDLAQRGDENLARSYFLKAIRSHPHPILLKAIISIDPLELWKRLSHTEMHSAAFWCRLLTALRAGLIGEAQKLTHMLKDHPLAGVLKTLPWTVEAFEPLSRARWRCSLCGNHQPHRVTICNDVCGGVDSYRSVFWVEVSS